MSWGPWIRKGIPDIGDWIQVECLNDETQESKVFEGMVAGISDEWIVEICPKPLNDEDFYAIRWRKKAK